ncbi:hypothetical protein MLD38_020379 [Melastoma candidum]|uniref:Uncharacterized protein n=1 Tax=Melastoma candidum TaxID=119954 RepID=A0ACB9QC69_9MYRT|nr:hypothetical protein MLD38_020379 [Melastoma candidum]
MNLLYPLVVLTIASPRVSVQYLMPQPSPATPPAATNITAILEMGGEFTFFIRLLKTTLIGNQLNSQINSNSTQGLTVFAPNDHSFLSLPLRTLNSVSDQQRIQLILFHVLPILITLPQLQVASNPLRTQAGASDAGQFALNVSTFGYQVSLVTGVVTATISSTIFLNSKVAIYLVYKVLLPMALFSSSAPAAIPPEPEKNMSTPASGVPTSSRSSNTIDVSAGITPNAFLIRTASYILVSLSLVTIALSY